MPNSGGNRPIIPILTGPTGSGKTSVINKLLGINPELHIISADSRQIYKYLNIGTDKPPQDNIDKGNYYLVDFALPGERYTAFDFVGDAREIISELMKKETLPIICGGTGLYIKSLAEGIVELPDDDLEIRRNLENEAVEKGPKHLFEKLQAIDPDEASRIHPNNIKKVIRALEIYYLTGRPKSRIIAEGEVDYPYRFDINCLMPSRERLYENIDARVDRMMRAGLLEEMEALYNLGLADKVREINVIGYNELFRHFDDQISLSAAVNLIKQNSRRFAKRQITWFRGMRNIRMFDTADSALQYLSGFWSPKIKT